MTQRLSGRAAVERNRRLLAANDVCHICGHPGSNAIDHVVPLNPRAGQPTGTEDPANLRPAHHNIPCPTCGRKCNNEKTNRTYAPIVRTSRDW
jgi:5-methylcytosine-specific restriction endonuclease McrA